MATVENWMRQGIFSLDMAAVEKHSWKLQFIRRFALPTEMSYRKYQIQATWNS